MRGDRIKDAVWKVKYKALLLSIGVLKLHTKVIISMAIRFDSASLLWVEVLENQIIIAWSNMVATHSIYCHTIIPSSCTAKDRVILATSLNATQFKSLLKELETGLVTLFRTCSESSTLSFCTCLVGSFAAAVAPIIDLVTFLHFSMEWKEKDLG